MNPNADLLTQQKFLEACEREDLRCIENMIANGMDGSLSNSLGLRTAAFHNHTHVVKCLLQHSNAKASGSEALIFALNNKNDELVDLLWDVSDVFVEFGGYYPVFYKATMLGVWSKVMPTAREHVSKIDTALWARSFLECDPSNNCPESKDVADQICTKISTTQIRQILSEMISSDIYICNKIFYHRLLDQVDDPHGEILAAAVRIQDKSIVRSLIGHPNYRTFIPHIAPITLQACLPLLIFEHDLLSILRVLPHTSNTFNGYIETAIKCGVPEILDLILEHKAPCNPSDPNGVAMRIATAGNRYLLNVLRIFERYPDLNVIPLFVTLIETPEENQLFNFLDRCNENDVVLWVRNTTLRDHIPAIQEFFAKVQNKVLCENIENIHPNAAPKRI